MATSLSGSFSAGIVSNHYRIRCSWTATQYPIDNKYKVRVKTYFENDANWPIYSTTTKTGSTKVGSLAAQNWSHTGLNGGGLSVLLSDVTSDYIPTSTPTVTVVYNIAATLSGVYYPSITATKQLELTPIDRNAPEVTIAAKNVTSNSFLLSASATYSCDLWQYKINNGAWTTFSTQSLPNASTTITGLSPGVTYTVQVQARRTSNHVYGTSSAGTVKTVGSSSISSVSDLHVDGQNPSVDVAASIFVAGYTHKLEVFNGSTLLLTREDITGSVGTNTITVQLTPEEVSTVLNSMPNDASISAKYRLTTYNGDTQVGSVSEKNGTILTSAEYSSPTLSAFTFKDTNASTIAVTGSNQKLIQGQSTLSVTASAATAKNGATISEYRAIIGEKTVSSASTSISFGEVDISGNVTITVIAVDSRGYTAQVGGTIEVFAYQNIQISELLFNRVNNYEAYCEVEIKGRFSTAGSNTVQSLKYRSKKTSEETYGAWTSLTPAVSGSSFLFEDDEFGDFASEYAWDVEFYVEDKLTNDNEFVVIVGGKPLVSLRKEKVGINNPNPTAALDVIGDIKQNGNLLADFIVEQGTSGIWTYRKWASGFVEQFGNFNYQNAEIRTTSGSIYYASSKQPPDYAIPFVSPPFVSYSLLSADAGYSSSAWITVDPNDTDTSAVKLRPSPFYLNAATARTLGHPFISIMAFGRWK